MDKLDPRGLTEVEFLKQYDPGRYPRPSVTVDIVVFAVRDSEVSILLIRRGGHPYIGQWALPGGFVNPDETVGEAAARELEEETGAFGDLEQLYTFSKPGRDPRTWTISCVHTAVIGGEIDIDAGSDAAGVGWFRLTAREDFESIRLELSNQGVCLSAVVEHVRLGDGAKIIENKGLAFDHAKIIAYAVKRVMPWVLKKQRTETT